MKFTEALPEGTVTVAGTVKFIRLLVTATEIGEGAGCDKEMAQEVDALAAMAVGEQLSEVTSTATLRLTVWVTPYPAAVKVTLSVPEVIVPEVAVKAAEVAPAGTLMEAGTLRGAALLDSAKNSGTAGAAAS